MMPLRVTNTGRGTIVGVRVVLADRWLTRLRGLLGHAEPGPGEGLLLSPCSSVHMVGMRFPIDVAFLDREGRVLAVRQALRPGLRIAACRGARYTLELRAGTLASTGTVPGDRLQWYGAGTAQGGGRGSHQETAS
jgi:uncharacterized membrane protein (UPF0127 family)